MERTNIAWLFIQRPAQHWQYSPARLYPHLCALVAHIAKGASDPAFPYDVLIYILLKIKNKYKLCVRIYGNIFSKTTIL